MSTLTYPSSLPCPRSSTVTPAERRSLSNASRPREARALARDRLEIEKIEFPPMTPVEFAAFRHWWEHALVMGGAWFAADWPLPRGVVTAVRKFIGAPVWLYIPGGFWKITATCQVRGRGEVPSLCFTERFNSGLSPYTARLGDQSVFVLSGHVLEIGPQTAGNASMRRSIGQTLERVNDFSVEFMVDMFGSDDGGEIGLMSGGSRVIALGPRVTANQDATQRGEVNIGGETKYVTNTSLVSGTWYRMDVSLAPGAGNTRVVVSERDTATIIKTTIFANDHTPPDIDGLKFSIDSSLTTSRMSYANAHFCAEGI